MACVRAGVPKSFVFRLHVHVEKIHKSLISLNFFFNSYFRETAHSKDFALFSAMGMVVEIEPKGESKHAKIDV